MNRRTVPVLLLLIAYLLTGFLAEAMHENFHALRDGTARAPVQGKAPHNPCDERTSCPACVYASHSVSTVPVPSVVTHPEPLTAVVDHANPPFVLQSPASLLPSKRGPPSVC